MDTTNLKETTSQRIKDLRLKHNYTMEVLSKKIGVSKSTIAKWENGYVDNMRQDNIMKLAELFNVPPTYILGYEEEEINREEKFIKAYKGLTTNQQALVDNLIETLLSKQ